MSESISIPAIVIASLSEATKVVLMQNGVNHRCQNVAAARVTTLIRSKATKAADGTVVPYEATQDELDGLKTQFVREEAEKIRSNAIAGDGPVPTELTIGGGRARGPADPVGDMAYQLAYNFVSDKAAKLNLTKKALGEKTTAFLASNYKSGASVMADFRARAEKVLAQSKRPHADGDDVLSSILG